MRDLGVVEEEAGDEEAAHQVVPRPHGALRERLKQRNKEEKKKRKTY